MFARAIVLPISIRVVSIRSVNVRARSLHILLTILSPPSAELEDQRFKCPDSESAIMVLPHGVDYGIRFIMDVALHIGVRPPCEPWNPLTKSRVSYKDFEFVCVQYEEPGPGPQSVFPRGALLPGRFMAGHISKDGKHSQHVEVCVCPEAKDTPLVGDTAKIQLGSARQLRKSLEPTLDGPETAL
ncbi:hypothetical protein HD554DRAFT_2039310 [Boletus coccyginus]|nr:hypothetical protein HD554DRAFT_2039310 [Boletus coccyginus]